MKLDFSKVYRAGILGKVIAESMLTISNFTRGTARGGHGQWSRRALQAAELIPAKAYFVSLEDFAAVCLSVDGNAIAKIQTAADVKFRTSEADDKSEKSSVYRNCVAMKALTIADFHNVGAAVDTLRKAGFTNVEVWVENPDGSDVPVVKPLALAINDIFYRALSASAMGAAIAKRGIGDGRAHTAKRTVKAALATA